MRFEKIQEFYEKVLQSEDSKILEEKLKKVKDEKSYKDFIQAELLPLAEKLGYYFSVDNIITYDKRFFQSLSEEKLASVTGGALKNIPGAASAFALLFMISAGGAASAIEGQAEISLGQSDKYQSSIVSQEMYEGAKGAKIKSLFDEQSHHMEEGIVSEEPLIRKNDSASSESSISDDESIMSKTSDSDYGMDEDYVAASPPMDEGDDIYRQDSQERIEELIENFVTLCDENYALSEELTSFEYLKFYQSALEEIVEVSTEFDVEEIQSCLSSGYLFRDMFDRVKELRGRKNLIASKVLSIEDLEEKDEIDRSVLHSSQPNLLLSQWETLCDDARQKNEKLRSKLSELRELQIRVEGICRYFGGFEEYSDLVSRWDNVYSTTERLDNLIREFLTEGDILPLMKKIDRVKLSQLTPGNTTVYNLIEEDERFYSEVTVEDIKEALRLFLDDFRNLSIVIDDLVEESWYVQAQRILQTQYDSLKRDLQVATERLSLYGKGIVINGNTAVVGDIHGYFKDVQLIIAELQSQLNSGRLDNVLFLGDILDRGPSSFIALKSVLEFFINNPGHVHILRGNHETLYRRHQESYFADVWDGAVKEDAYVWEKSAALVQETGLRKNLKEFLQYSRELPVFAVVNNEVLAVHGGIPTPNTANVEKFLYGDKYENEHELKDYNRTISCAVWSDFELSVMPREGYINSQRGMGICYGFPALKAFFDRANKFYALRPEERFDLKHIVRGHDHGKGPFDQEITEGISATTVISSASFVDIFRSDSEDSNKNHASVVLLEKGEYPKEYFGMTCNAPQAKGLVLEDEAFVASEIEILDIMYPLNPARIQSGAFVLSDIKKIIVHDEYSEFLLKNNRKKYGIDPEVEIEMRV